MANNSEFSAFNEQFQEAASENTSQQRLRELVGISTEVARMVASNVNAEPNLLEELSLSRDNEIRQSVAGNPNTPTDILWRLGEEFPEEILENPIFSLLLLENPNLVDEIPGRTLFNLLKLEQIPHSFMQKVVDKGVYSNEYSYEIESNLLIAIATNPKTPKSILTKLTKLNQDWNQEVVELATLHINFAGEKSFRITIERCKAWC
jgi:hypothetical protein